MSARIVLFIFLIFQIIYKGWYEYLEMKQKKKPLPEEIADIYDKERYQKFLDRDTEVNRANYLKTVAQFVFDAVIIFSPFYSYIDSICKGKVYLVFILTDLIFTIWGTAVGFVYRYYRTFKIDEKYGLNKKTLDVFVKDFTRDTVIGYISNVVLFIAMIFLFENLGKWTKGFSLGWGASVLLTAVILAAFFALILGLSLLSLYRLKKKYTFTRLPDGELRDKINALMVGAKKIKEIYVYDESKKSVDKNAFLLKLLWHREFGIADNFIDGNSERELLAVLSHEIGHLKHKKNWRNFIQYGMDAVVIVLLVMVIHNPSVVTALVPWIKHSFGITANNYHLILLVYSQLYTPVSFLTGLYSNYVSRAEEHEADFEAVKNGYGEELIATFKKLSSDELINIYPHPIIEFIENDHPGMYNRIVAIKKDISKLQAVTEEQ